jgi:4-hydroxy-tetrahydrodipicolinate synthase
VPPRLSGVLAPVLTPFDADLAPDASRFVEHCKWLLAHGCAALAPFGTTSEANSLSVDEREALLRAVLAAGIDPARLLPGTGCSALTDTVRLTRAAAAAGCAGVLLLPPFYYKGVSDEGLFRSVAEVIERVGDERLRVYLYHIPPIAQVGYGPRLVERLLSAYPRIIAGMKDSSGDWNNTKAMLDAFAGAGFEMFVGSERFLLRNLQNRGAGCITATANVNAAAIDAVFRAFRTPDAERLQQQIDDVRGVFEKFPVIAALKATVARERHDDTWRTVRPPLVELSTTQADDLAADLARAGFSPPT